MVYDAEMTREISDNSVDQAAMLLSTDWFLPYWEVIGIEVDEGEKSCFQQGCRKIVLELINGAEDYYLINFSPDRVEETRSKMRELVAVCNLKENARANLEELIFSKPQRQQSYSVAWLFMGVIKLLVADVELDEQIKTVLIRAETAFDDGYNSDFERLCIKSASQWDAYIRGLTPTMPATLSDLLFVSLLTSRWLNLTLQTLSALQRKVLFSRFKIAAESLSGLTIEENAWPGF